MRSLILKCLTAGLVTILPSHSTQAEPKSRDQHPLQPCSSVSFQPQQLQRLSPRGCVDTEFPDGSLIVIQYGRPKLRNPDNGGPREVFGFRVPYGQVWRAGADEATSFVTNTNLIIAGKTVPAGAYTLYVIPERQKPWKLIINTNTGQWGMPYPGQSSDLARIDMDSGLQRKTVDQLTFAFDSQSNNTAMLTLEWEGWKAAVKITKQP